MPDHRWYPPVPPPDPADPRDTAIIIMRGCLLAAGWTPAATPDERWQPPVGAMPSGNQGLGDAFAHYLKSTDVCPVCAKVQGYAWQVLAGTSRKGTLPRELRRWVCSLTCAETWEARHRPCGHPDCDGGTVVIVPPLARSTNDTYQEACPRCLGTGCEPAI